MSKSRNNFLFARAVTLLIILFLVSSCAQTNIDSTGVDTIFTEWDHSCLPGGSVSIIRDGEFVYAKGFGMANLESQTPNDTDTVFRIASISKQFTAAAIILLIEAEQLKFDDTLKQFYPEFPDYAEKITIRHLLNHTSGLRDYMELAFFAGKDADLFSDDEILNILVRQNETNFPPGESFLYCNSGYWLLGKIVEKVSGLNLGDFAQREIFTPLGMTNTHFHDDESLKLDNRASGFLPDGRGGYEPSNRKSEIIGDGGLFTTIDDMKKWDDAFYESDIFSSHFWELMLVPGRLNDGNIIEYASGLYLSKYRGLKTIFHYGAAEDFQSCLIRFPEQHFTIIIFSNRGDSDPADMAYKAVDIFLAEEYREISTDNAFVKLPKETLKKYIGAYWDAENFNTKQVFIKGNVLWMDISDNEKQLIAISKNEFKLQDKYNDILVSFYADVRNGQTMSLRINNGRTVFSKRYDPVSYSETELNKFSGTYCNDELDICYQLIMSGKNLTLDNGDGAQPFFEPLRRNVLFNAYGLFEFKENDDGDISGFRLTAGGVKKLSFYKISVSSN